MRLIDADAIEYVPLDDVYNRDVMVAHKEQIDAIPTVEAKLVYHSTRTDENGVTWVLGERGWVRKEE